MKITDVIGTPCLNTSKEELLPFLEKEAKNRILSVDFTNTHITVLRRTDASFREVTSSMDYFVPDSQVLKWAVNMVGGSMPERVYGPTFLAHAIRHTAPATRHYFLGASQDCLNLLIKRTLETNPAFQLVGSHNGYFKPEEEEAVVAGILQTKPDFVWVGLGTPRQQKWIHKYRDRFPQGALLAVGFAFDVNAGTKPDAPTWMQSMGLTWFFRLCSEPRRLLGRYFKYNLLFLAYFSRQMAGSCLPRKTCTN
jgi:N-acetylglucosaminyldiphosphoundecaprenol N-acetyl-beta-D-mannosaminyltransferase